MFNFDTINRGNYIKSYDFFDDLDEQFYDEYEPINIEEDEIEYT